MLAPPKLEPLPADMTPLALAFERGQQARRIGFSGLPTPTARLELSAWAWDLGWREQDWMLRRQQQFTRSRTSLARLLGADTQSAQ